MHGAFSDGLPAETPKQLKNVPNALRLPASICRVEAVEVAQLLSRLCHPDASARAVATDVTSLEWLKEAVARPLAPCPVKHVL